MVMVSAHRGGAGERTHLENTRMAMEEALELGVDFVEFDVQRCGDGTFILFHDDHVVSESGAVMLSEISFADFKKYASNFMLYDDALHLLRGKAKAHIDFKFTSPSALYVDPASTYEVKAAERAVDIIGVDEMIVTTLEDRSVKAVRAWSKSLFPDLLVGLSLGRAGDGLSKWELIKMRLSEIFPARRMKHCDANLVVANHKLADKSLYRWSRRRGIPLLVWTVDGEKALTKWLTKDDVWLVTTNFPADAMRIRGMCDDQTRP